MKEAWNSGIGSNIIINTHDKERGIKMKKIICLLLAFTLIIALFAMVGTVSAKGRVI